MLHMRRDHDDVAGLERQDLVVDVDRDISLEKKIKFIIIVGMQVYFGQIVVIIIVKFEIP